MDRRRTIQDAGRSLRVRSLFDSCLQTVLTFDRFIFLETDAEKQLNVEANARRYAEDILRVIKYNLRAVSGGRVSDLKNSTSFCLDG